MKIFVSYTLRDRVLNILKLREIEAWLSRYGSPYIDLLHNDSPSPQAYVISMLKQSSVFCAYLTPGFLKSEWVQLELELAYRSNIPVLWLNPQLPLIRSGTNNVDQPAADKWDSSRFQAVFGFKRVPSMPRYFVPAVSR
jgi:hypothetical protein